MENNQEGGNKKVYVAIIALLLLINGVALYLLYSENRAKKDLGESKAKLQEEFNGLNDTLKTKLAEIDYLITEGNIKDSTILSQRTELEAKQKQIQALFAKGKMTSKQLAEAKAQIAQYETAIAEMKKKIEELTAQNQQLTAQNQQLTTDLTTEKQTTSQLTEQNKGLSKKVELGSLLQLRNISFSGIKAKGNGKEVTEKRVKKLQKVQVSFETGDNKVLEPGTASVYVRIINPRGETISVADQGSGTLQTQTGESIQYTKKADFDWNQTNKTIKVDWSENIKESGVYKVEIYQFGYLIGKGETELK